jgi:glutathione peroxidase
VYDVALRTIAGELISMGAYRGMVVLVVNVASRCGYIPQYAGLEALYRRHKAEGFVVLGFPCDQFGHQEPGGDAEISQFCSAQYDVTFPLFSKIDVNGAYAHPLYQHLKAARKGIFGRSAILWNFSKFLLSREGDVIRRYGSRDTPERLEPDVETALGITRAS